MLEANILFGQPRHEKPVPAVSAGGTYHLRLITISFHQHRSHLTALSL